MDGSGYLAATLTDMMKREMAHPAVINGSVHIMGMILYTMYGKYDPHVVCSSIQVWEYVNYAVSDTLGVARFTKQTHDNNAGFEGMFLLCSSCVHQCHCRTSQWDILYIYKRL